MRRAAISIAFCGNLNLWKLGKITLGCVKVDERGVWINHPEGVGEDNKFLVPFLPSKSSPCLATIVITYLDLLHRDLPDLGSGDALFHSARKNGGFRKEIGVNMLAKIGVKVASMLGLENPEAYNPNCFKLLASESGIVKKRDMGIDQGPEDAKYIKSGKRKKSSDNSDGEYQNGNDL